MSAARFLAEQAAAGIVPQVTVTVEGKGRAVVTFPDGERLYVSAGNSWTLMSDPIVVPAEAVRDAWVRAGRVPGFHRRAQARLHATWPALASALEHLAGLNR